MTITLDDAGSGDLLFGIVIGAYRDETQEFCYDIIDVSFFQPNLFKKKKYLSKTTQIVSQLINRLQVKPEEEIHLCQGYIFDEAAEELGKTYGERVRRIRVIGEPQRLVEIAYLDEIRNLGYEPLLKREEERSKSFFHMMEWLKSNPEMIKYAKTGWPRLSRYRMFRQCAKKKEEFGAVCQDCGKFCVVPFEPIGSRSVYCRSCLAKKNWSLKTVN